MKTDFEDGSSPHTPLPDFSSFLGKTAQVARIYFSVSLHFFLRPQTLQMFFKMSLSSIFHRLPSAKKGEGLASDWKQGLRKRACRKASTLKEFTYSVYSSSRGSRPQPGEGALRDPAPGPAHPPPVAFLPELPSTATHSWLHTFSWISTSFLLARLSGS